MVTQSFQQDVIHLQYDRVRLASIAIAQRQVSSQSFQTIIGTFWQVILVLQDGTEIVIDEQSSPYQALTQAKKITSKLAVPIYFMDSEGDHHYAAHNLLIETQKPSHRIHVTYQGTKWHIYSKWQLSDTWQLLKQVFSQVGFIIFVMIITSFMIKLGGILHSFIASFLGWSRQTIVLSIPEIIGWLTPNLGARSYFELILAITVILVQGLVISQTKHIYLDENWLTYRVSNNHKRNIQTHAIEGILLITFPEPMILIIGYQTTIGIQNLPTPEAYPELLLQTEKALNSSQKMPSE